MGVVWELWCCCSCCLDFGFIVHGFVVIVFIVFELCCLDFGFGFRGFRCLGFGVLVFQGSQEIWFKVLAFRIWDTALMVWAQQLYTLNIHI